MTNKGLGLILPVFSPMVEKVFTGLRASWPAAPVAAGLQPQRWAHRRIDEMRFEKLEDFLTRRVRKVWPELDDEHLDTRVSTAISQTAAARSPRIAAAWIKSITLGWSTSHRLHRPPRACLFCGIPDCDSQLHMLRDCEPLRDLLRAAGVLPQHSTLLAAVTLPASKIDTRAAIITHHLYNKVAFSGLSSESALRALCKEFPAAPPLRSA